jgi:predicted ATPase
MTDPACRATLDVLTAVEEPAHFTDQNLRCLVVARIVNLSLERGNSDGSCVAYVQLGWFVGPRFGDYQAAFRFGKLGLDLAEKRGLERFRARVSQCFGYFVNPWSRHLGTSLELLRRSFTTAQEAGHLQYAVYSCDRLVTFLLAAGEPLGDVQREAQKGLEFARKAKFGYVVDTIVGQLRLIQTLRGLTQASPPSMMRNSMNVGSSSTWRQIRTWYSPGAGIGSLSCRRASTRATTLPPLRRHRRLSR